MCVGAGGWTECERSCGWLPYILSSRLFFFSLFFHMQFVMPLGSLEEPGGRPQLISGAGEFNLEWQP